MKNNNSLTRRGFLCASGVMSGTAFATLSGPALAFRAADRIKAATAAGDI